MGDLSVRVEFNGIVVDDRVVAVRSPIVLGDWPGTKVSFPGASLRISRSGSSIQVLDQLLEEGDTTSIALGPVRVQFEHTMRFQTLPVWQAPFDGRFLCVALVMISAGTWFDAADGWLERLPTTGEQTVQSMMRDLVDAVRTPNRRQWSAAVSPWGEYSTDRFGSNTVGDGPRHLNDDGNSGTGYYRWFRTAVPTDPLAVDANEQLVRNPLDAGARRVVARAAYNADHFQLAAWHYSALVERFPEDSGVRLRLAWAERRQGNHKREIELYREVLAQHPEQPYALGGLSMALARIGELDEALAMKDRLQVAAPTHPYTELTSGVLEATQGHELEAVECLRRAIIDREQFDRELQVELRRDISTDPALAPLRSDWRLRSMLRRHLGAAAPRRLPARSVRSR